MMNLKISGISNSELIFKFPKKLNIESNSVYVSVKSGFGQTEFTKHYLSKKLIERFLKDLHMVLTTKGTGTLFRSLHKGSTIRIAHAIIKHRQKPDLWIYGK